MKSPEVDRTILTPHHNHSNRWRFSDFLYSFWIEALHNHTVDMGD